MLYLLKVRFLKSRRGGLWSRHLRGFVHRRLRLGSPSGSYDRLEGYVRQYAPGRTFADIGCMWGVNGKFAFAAEDAGATRSVGVDVFGPTPEFEAERRERGSTVEFVLGDAVDADTIERVGEVDVVLCAGVLYHHPSPFDLLVSLRRMCRETLILRTSTIPEVDGLPNAAVFWPMLDERHRRLWQLPGLDKQLAITEPFAPQEGYGNWFWGMSPSCVRSLLAIAGFEVEYRASEGFAQTFVCRAVAPPLAHTLPSEHAARRMAQEISDAGLARPH
jgi:2-polyprenyl-3-methyl-5-hydroxy-6-metoxy-1,4-benzoquinol methylase